MNNFEYSVSLRITHPTQKLDDFFLSLPLKIHRSWNVGEKRKTPMGTPLGGVYKQSYLTATLGEKSKQNSKESPFSEYLRVFNEELISLKPIFDSIVKTGGKLNYFIGVFADENIGIEIYPSVLSVMSELNIGVQLDIYGPDNDQTAE